MLFAVPANAYFVDGNYFLTIYKDLKNGNRDANNYLAGYVGGLYDSFEKELNSCIGKDIHIGEIINTVASHIINNSYLVIPVRDVFVDAVKSKWNCN